MIARTFRIANHPVAQHPDKLKARYVRGLSYVLHTISEGNPNMRMIFNEWGYSIMGEDVSKYFDSSSPSSVKDALALNRIGLNFFRLKHQFYYDCFYLTEIFNPNLLEDLYDILIENGSSVFTKSSLKITGKFFIYNDGNLNVEAELMNHRNENKEFTERREVRALIVATVSAGKSTLINALTGRSFNKVMNGVCTKSLCEIHNKKVEDGISLKLGEYIGYSSDIDSFDNQDSLDVAFHFNSNLGDQRICLLDTPGVNNSRDTDHYKITAGAIKSQTYDFIIFISNGQYNGTNDESRLLKLLKETTNRPILFVLNQLDKFNSKVDDIGKMIYNYGNELITIGFEKPQIFPMSAQYAYLLRTEHNLDEEEHDELNMLRKRFSNGYLDLKKYIGGESMSEIEKTGIIQLEFAIKKLITQ